MNKNTKRKPKKESNVFAFPTTLQPKKQVPLPPTVNKSEVEAICYTGSAFTDRNIKAGDYLVYRKDFILPEITPDKICVVYIPARNELSVRHIEFHQNNIVTLSATDASYGKEDFTFGEIEIRGLVISVCFDI